MRTTQFRNPMSAPVGPKCPITYCCDDVTLHISNYIQLLKYSGHIMFVQMSRDVRGGKLQKMTRLGVVVKMAPCRDKSSHGLQNFPTLKILNFEYRLCRYGVNILQM